MSKIPIGISSFQTLRDGGYYYVDKTRHLYDFANSASPLFLSRPRRFGKTLLMSALEAILLGQKDLFKGLWIFDSDYDWKPWPVIHLSFVSVATATVSKLERSLIGKLRFIAEAEGLEIDDKRDHSSAFESLIRRMSDKHGRKVAILIDEYDAPILSEIGRPRLAEQIRDSMGKFYGVLKDCEKKRGPTFLTGVTKFAQTSLFSKLNNLEDLSLDPKFADICGLTYEEFDAFLVNQASGPKAPSQLDQALEGFISNGYLPSWATVDDLRNQVLAKYDGYTWDGKTRLLNPWSVFNAFKTNMLDDFWLISGPLKFLPDMFSKDSEIRDIFISKQSLPDDKNYIDIGDRKPPALLFQSGYLTKEEIKVQKSQDVYSLRFPNAEVEDGLYRMLLSLKSAQSFNDQASLLGQALLDALTSRDALGFQRIFSRILSTFKPDQHIPKEKFYQTILQVILTLVGHDFDSQADSGDGILDIHLKAKNGDEFIIEMKYVSGRNIVGESGQKPKMAPLSPAELAKDMKNAANKAMKQIENKKYTLRFMGKKNIIYKTALIIGHYSDVLIVFEKADNWHLTENSNGLYIVQEDSDK